jgi:Nucleotidyl transferase AbiEii toxin, Type IV TA system
MDSSNSKLSELQKKVLQAFFARERRFRLTGGAALAGFYLGHRVTDDLDLFTAEADAFATAKGTMEEVTSELGGSLIVRQDAPRFKRLIITAFASSLVIDLVHDTGSELLKREIDGIVVDSPEEIVANKLTTLVGRAEERDIVDLYFLERAGYPALGGLALALEKDGGCTPATLAWLLSEVEIPDVAKLPGDVSASELRSYVQGLVTELRRLALPTL